VEPKYKVGDLVKLTEFGSLVIDENKKRVGLITRGPLNFLYPEQPFATEEQFQYLSYDIMMGEELIISVPQEFIMPLEKDEDGDK
jgi:hypothetical protein